MSKGKVQRVVDALRRYSTFAFPIRLMIGAVVTVVAGTGLGFIAEYASYSWAIYYGIRPPLEGIPYLKLAVSALTIAIFLGGALLYVAIHFAAGALLGYANVMFRQLDFYAGLVEKIAPKSGAKSIRGAMFARLRTLKATHAVAFAIFTAGATFIGCRYLPSPMREDPYFSSLISTSTFVLVLMLWNTRTQAWIALLAVVGLIAALPLSFFHVDFYSKLLRTLGYGGGLPVSVTVVEDPDSDRKRTVVEGFLMLRTTSAILLFDSKQSHIREIPLQQVLFIDHAAVRLSGRKPALPLN
jgi:preprotein translocase subunit SecE